MNEIIVTGKTVEEATEKGCAQLGKSRDEVSVEILEMPVKKLFKSIPAKVKITVLGGAEPVAEPVVAPQPQAAKPVAAPVAAPPQSAAPVAPAAPAAAAPPPAAEKPAKKAVLTEEEPTEDIDLSQNKPAAMACEYLLGIFKAMGSQDVNITAFKQGDATLLRVEGADISSLVETKGETIQALSYLTDRTVNKGVDKKDPDYLRLRLDVAGYRGRREGELVELAKRTGSEVARTKRSRTLAPMNPYERLIVHTTISEMENLISESIGSDTERRVVIKSTEPGATDGEDWRPARSGGRNNNRGGGGRDRDRRNNNRSGGRDRERNSNNRGGRGPGQGGKGFQRSSAPEREYADRPRDPDQAPIVPKRKDAVLDGEDLPLYGKIEL